MCADRDAMVALVAGAASELGRPIVARLSAAGLAVVSVDTPESSVEEGVRSLVRAGGRVIARPGAVASTEEAERCVQAAVATFGRLDLVVVCGPKSKERSLGRLERAAWEAAVDSPLGTTFVLCQAAARLMLEAGGGGRIVCVGVGPGLPDAGFGQAHVAAAGGGIAGIVRAVAAELIHKGISVNGVLSRGAPEVTASIVEFLASDAAAGITGQVALVDGRRLSLLQVGQTAGAVSGPGGWSAETIAAKWAEISR